MRILTLILALLAASPALADTFGERRQYFGGWLTVCRSNGYCSATAYVNPHPPSGAVADYILRVGRQAQQTYWEVSFTTIEVMGDGRQPFTASIDRKGAIAFAPPREVGPFGSVNDFFYLGRKAQALLDRLVPAKRLTIGFAATDGSDRQATFALSGLSQALIWIDTVQHRLGSERVAEAPPYGLFRTDVVGANWMAPALEMQ